jgi:hypothetical protein
MDDLLRTGPMGVPEEPRQKRHKPARRSTFVQHTDLGITG